MSALQLPSKSKQNRKSLLPGFSVIKIPIALSSKVQGLVLGSKDGPVVLRGPLVSCEIRQQADTTPFKLLNNSFLFDTFGSKLCSITISGVYYWVDMTCTKKSDAGQSPAEFYRQYSIAYPQNKDKRLTIQMGGSEAVYTCVLIGLDRSGQSNQSNKMLTQQYTIHLLGIVQ